MKLTQSFQRHKVTPKWHVIDLEGVIVGRASVQIADILRGKNKTTFTPNADTGDYVIAINAGKAVFTGNKETEKRYYRHSLYMGGLRSRTVQEQRIKDPTKIVFTAVKGMLPKNKLGRRQLMKLKVYAGTEHGHDAQQPVVCELDKRAKARG